MVKSEGWDVLFCHKPDNILFVCVSASMTVKMTEIFSWIVRNEQTWYDFHATEICPLSNLNLREETSNVSP